MVERVIYADNTPEGINSLFERMGFPPSQNAPRAYPGHAELEVSVLALHCRDPFGNPSSKVRVYVSDRHYENGVEVLTFCDAAKPVYEAILAALKNKIIYDPMNRVDY